VEEKEEEQVRRTHANLRARLRALQLVEYQSVIVLDADFLVKTNMDSLFEQESPLAVQTGYVAPLSTSWFVIKPSCQDFNNINEIARSGTFDAVNGWMHYGVFPHWRSHRGAQTSQWGFEGAAADTGLLYYYYYLTRGDITLLPADYDVENAFFTHFVSTRPWTIPRDNVEDLSERLQGPARKWWLLLDQLQSIAAEANLDVNLDTMRQLTVAQRAASNSALLALKPLFIEDPYTNSNMKMMMQSSGSGGLISSLPGPAQFIVGVAESFIGKILPNWVNCMRGVDSLVSNVQSLFNDFHSGITSNLKKAVYDLASILSGIKGIVSKCGLTEVVEKITEFVAKVYSGFGDIVIGAELVLNGVNIYHNFDDALHAWKAGNWEQMGKDVGSIIGYVV